MALMEAMVQQRKNVVLISVKQTQNFACVYIAMVMIVACLSMDRKYLSLRLIIKIIVNFLNQFS